MTILQDDPRGDRFREKTSTTTISQVRGLAAPWYHSPTIYDLERRAIFSKKWLFVTHRARFQKSGDFVCFEEAGFPFFLILDKELKLKGFHNACRHRAFPIITKDQGNARIIACNYHGWSYGINGNLAKAPRFEDVPGFQKSENGLWPVHVHVDALGFVWVNLEASEKPSVRWEDDFNSVDTQKRFRRFDFSQYSLDHTWNMKADYNWKTLADNYNECYHCQVAHPDVNNIADFSRYDVEPNAGYIRHFYQSKPGKEEEDVKNMSTFYFPNACMSVSSVFFYLMRCVPTSPTTVSMEYEVYRHKDASDEDFEKIDSFFKRVLNEDKDLCVATQRNLNAGVYVNGQMHQQLERGPIYFQSLVRNLVSDHKREEKRVSAEIWPSRRKVNSHSQTDSDLEFCSGVECHASKLAKDW